MTLSQQQLYLFLGFILFLALVLDLGILSKKNNIITFKKALLQTFLWVLLGLSCWGIIAYQQGSQAALEYISAYLMEWSLSIDNIFIFIIIFSAFHVKEKYYSRVLLIGILIAIIFRIIFIAVGTALIAHFTWLFYVFGVFLLYTGFSMFKSKDDKTFDPHQTKLYKVLKKFLPIVAHDGNGKFIVKQNNKPVYTTLFVVVVSLAAVDLVFALDSIPAVMGISKNNLVIYTSNIFAVLGLRSLFFLLRGAVNTFKFLQQGIAIVLVFIGLKMLGEHFINQWLSKNEQLFISLLIIIICIFSSILLSIFSSSKKSTNFL